jgi:hypothetical protein
MEVGMIRKQDFKRVDDTLWEIPQSFREDMRVPARIYADDQLLEAALGEKSVEQLVNTASLPGTVAYVLAMPTFTKAMAFRSAAWLPLACRTASSHPAESAMDINWRATDGHARHARKLRHTSANWRRRFTATAPARRRKGQHPSER